MVFLYDVFSCFGYFLVMIIFMVIAIIAGKSKAAWIWYGIGGALQLMSLSGRQKAASFYGTDITLYWVVYFALLILTAVLIVKRYNKANR